MFASFAQAPDCPAFNKACALQNGGGTPCGTGCNRDDFGDKCEDMDLTITDYKVPGSAGTIWWTCSGLPSDYPGAWSCQETPRSCGTPVYYWRTFGSGSGNSGCQNSCRYTAKVWVSCAAVNGSTRCDGQGSLSR